MLGRFPASAPLDGLSMKIIACIKRVPATDAQAKIDASTTGLDTSSLQYMTSFYDEIAVEEAVKTKESQGGEVTVLTLGPSASSKEVRECLAKGADAGVILTDDGWQARDCRSTAKALVGKISELGADLVFCGKVATDRDNAAVGPMLATYLGWACVTDVCELQLDGASGVAKRSTEAGVESVSFSLPAVITCDKGLNEPRYAGLKGIMAAKKKPLDEVASEIAESHAQVVSLETPKARPEGRIIGEGAAAVDDLIAALRNEAKVL
jgi:electron transfer flavoprotein beta subunit